MHFPNPRKTVGNVMTPSEKLHKIIKSLSLYLVDDTRPADKEIRVLLSAATTALEDAQALLELREHEPPPGAVTRKRESKPRHPTPKSDTEVATTLGVPHSLAGPGLVRPGERPSEAAMRLAAEGRAIVAAEGKDDMLDAQGFPTMHTGYVPPHEASPRDETYDYPHALSEP